MRSWRQLTAAAVLAVAAIGLPVATPAAAQAATVTCPSNAIGGHGDLADEPIAGHANQAVYPRVVVHNNTAKTLHNVYFNYQIASPTNRHTPAPTVWWHVPGYSWHPLTLAWYPAVKGGSSGVWVSNDARLGDLGAHASRTLVFSIRYPSGAVRAFYPGELFWRSTGCLGMLGALPLTTAYRI
jgi:hypothetical protein